MRYVVLAVVAIVVVIGVSTLGWLYAGRVTAPIRGVTEQVEITNSGAYRVQGYEKFYRWHEELDAIDNKLLVFNGVLSGRDYTNCLGLRAYRADVVGKYNSASRARETIGQWRPADLPYQLDHVTGRCGLR